MASIIDRTATMTSNSLPVPNVTSDSSSGVGEEAYHAFDKNLVSGGWISTITTGWIKYDFGSSKWASDGYSILVTSATTRAPKDFTFQGSNDDSNWTVLDTQTGITTWVGGTKKSFSFTNFSLYRYYKLNVSANNGDGSVLEVDEIEIFAPDLGILGGEI